MDRTEHEVQATLKTVPSQKYTLKGGIEIKVHQILS
jgi:hypothetical protein